jgi:DNA polymerase III alpha subunit
LSDSSIRIGVSPPDFDIDFSWNERDDVTEYIFERYGKATYCPCLLHTIPSRANPSSANSARSLDFPKRTSTPSWMSLMAVDKHHPFAKHIFKYGKMIEKFPNYLSIHAGGILISEKPLNYHTALQLMPKGFPIVHFDMYGAEDLEYHKYDVLSQRGLGHIKDAVDLVKQNQGQGNRCTQCSADQRRSQGQGPTCVPVKLYRLFLHRVARHAWIAPPSCDCDDYIHLVAASSIIRPGVAKSRA